MDREDIEKKLNEFKRNKKDDFLYLLPVYHEDRLKAYLHPITYDYNISLPGIVPALSQWRRDTPFAWNSVFEVTDERTEKWLEKFVLNKKDRIIFIIKDLQNNFVGQIGLAGFNYSDESAEIDAVVRGRKDVIPGIMSAALNTIIKWGRDYLGIGFFFLNVFDDNTHAIEFYKKNNFIEEGRIALVKEQHGTEINWKEDSQTDASVASRCYIKMKWENKQA